MTVRIQYASGRTQLCPLTLDVISGNLTSSEAGTYYFWLQGRNDIGYCLVDTASSVTVGENDGIELIVPADAYRTGENWLQYAITVNTSNNPSTAKLLFLIDAIDASQNSISLPLTVNITEPSQLVTEESVSSFPTTNLLNGTLRSYTPNGSNYRFVEGSSATPDSDEIFAGVGGQWFKHYDGFETYLTDTTDTTRGCDTPLQLIDSTRYVINFEYALDGSSGKYRRYWVYNTSATDLEVNKRVGLTVTNAGEDVSSSYIGLLQTEFEGHFDRASTQSLITTKNGVDTFTYLNVTESFSSYQNNFIIERALPTDWAFQFKVWPEFDVSQISSSNIIPAYGSELNISPFVYANQSKPTDLGAFLGNAILSSNLGYRRILPATGLSALALSGSGLVSNFYWQDVAQSTVLGLQQNTANQIIAVNTNGLVYRVSSLNNGEDQRALVSTASGESEVATFTSEVEGDTDPDITITVTYPSAIRSNYDDVIAGSNLGTFNAEEVVAYVRKKNSSGGAVAEARRISGLAPTNTVSDQFTFTYSDGSTYTSGNEPDTSFGLFAPSTPTVDTITNTTGTFYYEVTIAFKYNGDSVTAISHKTTDGCIDEINQSLAEITSTTRFWREPKNTASALSSIPADELIQGANYPVLEDLNGDISFYTYDSSSSEIVDDFNYLDVDNGSGRFVRIKGLDGNDGSTGFGIFYTFSTSTSTSPSAGQVRFNNANYASVTAIYLSETDRNSTAISSLLNEVADGSILAFVDSDDPTRYAYYSLSSQTDNGTWRTFNVSHITNSGALTGNLTLAFALKGADGATGATGATGETGAAGSDGVDGTPGFGVDFEFDSGTSATPGTGQIRFNNANPASATAVYVSETDNNAVNVSSVLELINIGSPLQIIKATDSTTFALFEVDTITDNGTDRTYGVTPLANNGSFADTDIVRLTFSAKGDTGAAGPSGGVDSFNGRTGVVTPTSGDYDFADLGTTPTTLAGYGITDAQPLDADLTAIAALSSTGIPQRTAADTWSITSTGATGLLLLGDNTEAEARATLSLGNLAVVDEVADAQIASAAAIAWSKISKTGAVASDVGASASTHDHQPSDIALTLLNSFTAYEASNRLIVNPDTGMATIMFAVARTSIPAFGTTLFSWSSSYASTYPTAWVGTAIDGSYNPFQLRLYIAAGGSALQWHLLSGSPSDLSYAIGQITFAV
jgi:hypothetical protein